MTNRTALIALRDAVVEGWFPADTSARDLGLAGIVEKTGLPIINIMYSAFSGSIDAAVELMEVVLHEAAEFHVRSSKRYRGESKARIHFRGETWEAKATSPARALFIATLNAMIEGGADDRT